MSPANARAKLAGLHALLKARVDLCLDGAATAVAADIRSRLQRATPSRPGRSSGALARAIETGRDPESGSAVVTVDTPYAAALEYGTARMPARPFLRPAAAEAEPEISERLATVMADTCRTALDDAS